MQQWPADKVERRSIGSLMPLDKAMREQIASLAKPYPKRDKQAMTDTLGTAAGQLRPSRSNQEIIL